MIEYLKKNPLIRFLVVAFSLYLVWYFLYHALIVPKTDFDRNLSIVLVESADMMLSVLGYDAIPNYEYTEVTIKLSGSLTNGVWVGEKCDGMELFSLFAIYIIAFPGPWKKKLWFIPLGIFLIHILNTIRVAALTVIERDAPESLDFNHDYTFTITVYAFIFFLWYWWTVKLSGVKLSRSED